MLVTMTPSELMTIPDPVTPTSVLRALTATTLGDATLAAVVSACAAGAVELVGAGLEQ
jgi:hypothetical protein